MNGSHRFALASAILILCVFGLGVAPGWSQELDRGSRDWSNIWSPDRVPESGMLVPGRLVVGFAVGGVPSNVRTKSADGLIATSRPDLNLLSERHEFRGLDRMFPPVGGERNKRGELDRRARTYIVQFDDRSSSLEEVAASIRSLPGVEYVEPDAIALTEAVVPNDPLLPGQYWLQNSVPGEGDIRAIPAWYHSVGSSEIIVCVADSGVDWQHPDLGGTAPDYSDGVIWANDAEVNGVEGVDDDGNGHIDDIRGWDFVDAPSQFNIGTQPPQDALVPDNDPMDYGGHGTSVAGCVSAISNNGIGVASTTWSVKIMPCRVSFHWLDFLGVEHSGRLDSFFAQAVDYARINGAHVLNHSFKEGTVGPSYLLLALDAASAAGMVLVDSAGNEDTSADPGYMALRSDFITVAAVTSADTKSDFSNFGSAVDISAPGSDVLTTGFDRFSTGEDQHVYQQRSGTSFASPIVAGAVAMAMSIHPGLTRQEYIDIVVGAADDISAQNPGYNGRLGSGRLNMAKLRALPTRWTVPELLPQIELGLNYAAPGDTVAVAGDFVLDERIQLYGDGLFVQGGWDPTFTTRDLDTGRTLIDVSNSSQRALTVLDAVADDLVFDGFILRGGRADFVTTPVANGYIGGTMFLRNASPTFRNLLVEGGVAGFAPDLGLGGGVAILGGAPVFENCEFRNNTALQGAAIYAHEASPTFDGVFIHDNITRGPSVEGSPQGGAAFFRDCNLTTSGLPVTLRGGQITGHDVEGPGGGIFAENTDLILDGVEIAGNAASGHGAGVRLVGGSYQGTGNRYSGNLHPVGSFFSGAGLSVEGASVSIDGSVFSQNVAGFGGGGLYVITPSSFDVRNSTFVENGTGFLAGGLYVEGSLPGSQFVQNTVAHNLSGSVGAGGVYVTSGELAVSNSVIAFNGGGGTSVADGLAATTAVLSVDCSLVFGNDAGNYGGLDDPTGLDGNISVDPEFCDPLGGNYNFLEGSPVDAVCGHIGAGTVGCTIVGIEDPLPSSKVVWLGQNWPNPFNPATTIAFELPVEGRARVRVFDLRGREVRLLLDEERGAGRHVVRWNGRDGAGRSVASGTYFYELTTANRRLVRKMGLLK